jgi:hypothetical protein
LGPEFDLDIWYVENMPLRVDLAILFRMVAHVLGQRGVSAEGHTTMPEFMGKGDNESAR